MRWAIAVGILAMLAGCAALKPRPPIEVEHYIPPDQGLPASLEECKSDQEYRMLVRQAERQIFRIHGADGHFGPNYREAIEARDRIKGHAARCAGHRRQAEAKEWRDREEAESRKRAAESQARIDAMAAERRAYQNEVADAYEKMSTPQAETALLRGLYCEAEALEKAGLEAIADEREASKIAGLVNQARIYSAQQIVHAQRQRMKRLAGEIRNRKGSPPRDCESEEITGLIICHRAGWPVGECRDADEKAAAEAMRLKIDELDG